jgi:hypothetical protein
MTEQCFRCGKRGANQHHLTLRDENGERLDDALTVPLCHNCHCAEHDWLRLSDLQRAPGPLSLPERVELRLRRLAVFFERLVMFAPFSLKLAAALSGWADELARHTAGLDRCYPRWREGGAPG